MTKYETLYIIFNNDKNSLFDLFNVGYLNDSEAIQLSEIEREINRSKAKKDEYLTEVSLTKQIFSPSILV